MKKLISILFLSLMLLQAIPVLHFFASQKEIFYAYIDEEKPNKGTQETKEAKEFITYNMAPAEDQEVTNYFSNRSVPLYRSPILEFLTPPPNHC